MRLTAKGERWLRTASHLALIATFLLLLGLAGWVETGGN